MRIKLFHLYKTDIGHYIPLKSKADDWYDGVINQDFNEKLKGWYDFKLMGGRIEDCVMLDERQTIGMLFSLS
jgi:hypothetical protein